MKKLVSSYLWMMFTVASYAQNNVVVFVQVNSSIPRLCTPSKIKSIIIDMLKGNPLKDKDFTYTPTGGGIGNTVFSQPIVGPGSKLMVMPYGERSTGSEASFQVVASMSDVDAIISKNFPSRFSDANTYITLAKARALGEAKKNGITNLIFLNVADNNVNNNTALNCPGCTQEEKALVKDIGIDYNEKQMGTIELGSTSFMIIATKLEANAGGIVRPAVTPTPAVTPSVTPKPPPPVECRIDLTSYAGGKSGDGRAIEVDENVTFSWTCNCTKGARYSINISPLDKNSGAKKEVRNDLTTNTYATKLESGDYRVTISGSNDDNISITPGVTYIHVKGGGVGGILLIILILVAAGLGFWYWNNSQRSRKVNSSSNNNKKQPQSPFQSNSGNNTPNKNTTSF